MTSPYDWESCFCVGGVSLLYMQDQYINHIMNETGAAVILRGHGSGNTESPSIEGTTLLNSCNMTLVWSAMDTILYGYYTMLCII